MKKVTSYTYACEILGLDPEAKPDVSKIREKDQKAFLSLFEITIIVEAQNKLNDWSVDWMNRGQYKYYPWFYIDEDTNKVSGVGLSYFDCANTRSHTAVGSHLVVGTEEEAEYLGNLFIELYESWLLF